MIRLFGSSNDMLFCKSSTGQITRRYSADLLNSTASATPVSESTDTKGVDFSLIGNTIVLTYAGVKYISTTTQTAADAYGIKYSKITRVAYPNGYTLSLLYDADMNIQSVADSRNNNLVFTHEIKTQTGSFWNSTTTQTPAQRKPITGVVLTSGSGAKQSAGYTYSLFNTVDANNTAVSIYKMDTSYSTIGGNTTYNYTAVKQYAMANTNAAVLTSVSNSSGVVQRKWEITGKTATAVTVRSYQPLNNGSKVGDTTTVYDDVARTISFSFSPNGINTSTVVYTQSDIDSRHLTIKRTSGTYPILTAGGKPVIQADIDLWSGVVQKVITARNAVATQTVDARLRSLVKTTLSGDGGATDNGKTVTNSYTTLTNGLTNNFSTPNTITAPKLEITNEINAAGQVVKTTKKSPQAGSLDQVATYTYYSTDASLPDFGLLKTYDGPRSTDSGDTSRAMDDTINYTYDNNGNLATETRNVMYYDQNTSKTYTKKYSDYNNAGQVTLVDNFDGTADFYQYDARFRLTDHYFSATSAQTVGASLQIHYDYNDLNQLTAITNENNKITRFTYDEIGRLTRKTLPGGNYEVYDYYPNGAVKSISHYAANNVLAQTEWQTVDALGRVSQVRIGNDASKLWKTLNYDANNNVTSTQTALRITESWTYDGYDRPITHTDGMGNVDKKWFDVADNVLNIRDANVNVGADKTYINQNVIKTDVDTDYGSKTYSYDLADNVTARTHGGNSCNFNHIDQLGRMQGVVCTQSLYATNANFNIMQKYVYNQNVYGRLDVTWANNGIGTQTNYTYDDLGRITFKNQLSETLKQAANSPFLGIGYGYQPMSSYLYSTTLPSGKVIQYTYATDTRDQLTGISVNGTQLISNISYDGAFRLTGWNWGNTAASYLVSYNSLGQIMNTKSSIATGALTFNANYSLYDADGRLKTQAVDGVGTFTYAYDANSQLINETAYGLNYNYSYDRNGNRLDKTMTSINTVAVTIPSESYTYTGNKLTKRKIGGVSTPNIVYTDTGNMVPLTATNNTHSVIYGADGRRHWTAADPNSTYGKSAAWMDYNHKGERIFRNDRQYMYNEASQLVGEYDVLGKVVVEYVWFGAKPIAALYPNNRIVYIVSDYQDKPRVGVDAATNQTVWTWHPEAFGVKQPTENGAQINLRFPGQYYDNGTGMYYNLNRFYDPRLGRYWEADPLGLDGGLNPYAYAGNNPVMNIDPTGLFSLGKLSSIIDDIGHSASNAINNGIKGIKDYFKNGGTVGVSNDNTGYSITTNGMTSGGNSIDASMHVGGGSSSSIAANSGSPYSTMPSFGTMADTADYSGDVVVGPCVVDCYYDGSSYDVGGFKQSKGFQGKENLSAEGLNKYSTREEVEDRIKEAKGNAKRVKTLKAILKLVKDSRFTFPILVVPFSPEELEWMMCSGYCPYDGGV